MAKPAIMLCVWCNSGTLEIASREFTKERDELELSWAKIRHVKKGFNKIYEYSLKIKATQI